MSQHPPQFPNIGAGQDLELLEWLNNVIFPMEAKFEDLDFATKAYAKSVRRFIDAGVRTSSSLSPLELRDRVIFTPTPLSPHNASLGSTN